MQTSTIAKTRINSSAPENSPDATDVMGSTFDTTESIDEMLASFSQKKSPSDLKINEHRKAPRYRVKWKAKILIDDKSTHQGFINDISMIGASICLNTSIHTTKCTLRILVPPLNLVSKPRLIEVSGKSVYVVFDGRLQFYRLAISFLGFRQEADRAFLEEHLTRHHSPIPEC